MSVSGHGLRRLGAPVQHALKVDVSRCRMLGQPYLMKLRPLRENGCHCRRSETASKVAHEVNQARYGIPFLLRNSDVRDRCSRDKNEAEGDILDDAKNRR